MPQNKTRFALWAANDALKLVKDNYEKAGCKSQSEYIERAIRFYSAYLAAEDSEEYLPRVLGHMLEGYLNMSITRIGRMLFKLAVEVAIGNHLQAFAADIDESTLDSLRKRCVDDVKYTNGQISFKEILRFQKGE